MRTAQPVWLSTVFTCCAGNVHILCRWEIGVFVMGHAQIAHSTAISSFVDSLQEPRTPYISPKRLSQALGVKVANLAQLTGVHRNTLRNPASERLQGRMREMVKVISAATELT